MSWAHIYGWGFRRQALEFSDLRLRRPTLVRPRAFGKKRKPVARLRQSSGEERLLQSFDQ